MSNASKPAMTVPLTPDFRLSADERNFIVQERKITQPAVNPPEGYVYVPREKWDNIAFYSLSTNGLLRAIDYVVMRSAAGSVPESVSELFAQIQSISDGVHSALEALISRRKRGETAAETVAEGKRTLAASSA